MARPSQKLIVIFPEVREITKRLTNEQFGILIRAVIDYRIDGTVYDGGDVGLDIAFSLMKSQLDRYDENAATNSMNAKKKKQKQNAAESSEMQRNETELSEEETEPPKAGRKKGKPPPSPSPNPSPYPSPSPNPNPYPDPNISISAVAVANREAAAQSQLSFMQGKLGKGVVSLTDEQFNDLLEKMGIDMVDYYVPKLADFIIKNQAKVKSHYETILRWWREDSRVEL